MTFYTALRHHGPLFGFGQPRHIRRGGYADMAALDLLNQSRDAVVADG